MQVRTKKIYEISNTFVDLFNGGTTPCYGMIHSVRNSISIPLFVLIRPRAGDFNYSESEFQVMVFDIEMCSKLKG